MSASRSRSNEPSRQTLFVTGADTGAGKTVLTALLLHHLRSRGIRALAMKPFSSGDRGDARLLLGLQAGEVRLDEINPFHFSEPVAPAVALRRRRRRLTLDQMMTPITALQSRCEVLLIEGCGGVLVPLSAGVFVADLIQALECPVVVACRNKLGAINHALLTRAELVSRGVKAARFVLMGAAQPDPAARANAAMLRAWCPDCRVMELPFLGRGAATVSGIQKKSRDLKKTLALIAGSSRLRAARWVSR